jgi:hypothetical protein
MGLHLLHNQLAPLLRFTLSFRCTTIVLDETMRCRILTNIFDYYDCGAGVVAHQQLRVCDVIAADLPMRQDRVEE